MDLLNLINNLKHANISPLLETCKALHVTLCTFRISIFKRASKFAKPQDLANFQRKYQQTPKASRSGADFSRINFVQTCNSFSFKSTLSKPTRFTGNVFWPTGITKLNFTSQQQYYSTTIITCRPKLIYEII